MSCIVQQRECVDIFIGLGSGSTCDKQHVECYYREDRRMLLRSRRNNVNTCRSHEPDKFVQVFLFTLLSRTETIGRVTFVRDTVG